MTVIEFFDKSAIENLAGALLCKPRRVIFVGASRRKMENSIKIYQRILRDRGIDTALSCQTVGKGQLEPIISALCEIVQTEDDCVFDLTGGEELYLVAVGAVMARYPDRVRCQRFNYRKQRLSACDAQGRVIASQPLRLSVAETVQMRGGRIVTDPARLSYTYDWDFSEDFVRDAKSLWGICRRDTARWNKQIRALSTIDELNGQMQSLSVRCDRAEILAKLGKRGIRNDFLELLPRLESLGVIRELQADGVLSYTFKNEQIKRCLVTEGQILEIAVACRMRALRDRDGSPLYDDVRVGVVMDWDEQDGSDPHQTVNEIDVMATKGAIPIFISCKNGDFYTEELYKLAAVSGHFGGKYAKRALVSTNMERFGEKADYLKARMQDMHIHSIENADAMADRELDSCLRTLWQTK